MRSEALSRETGCEVWLKFEGANPTGSFKDRGMTLAISKAVEEGSKAVVCASTGNTSASAAAYAAKAGLTCAVLVPKGKIALGKMAAHARARRAGAGGRGELRRVARARARARRPLPGHARELGQPVSARRGRRRARSRSSTRSVARPTSTACRSATPGTSRATGCGYTEYLRDGMIHEPPRLFGFQARGAAPIVLGQSGGGSADDRDARSGSATRRRGTSRSRPRRSPRARSWRSPTARSSPRTGGSRARGCSPSPRRPRASPGCSSCRRRTASSRAARRSSACSPATG